MNKPPKISMFGDPLGGGSTAKIAIRLAKGFVSRSVVTDLLVSQCRHPTLETTTTGIEVIKIGTMRPFARTGHGTILT